MKKATTILALTLSFYLYSQQYGNYGASRKDTNAVLKQYSFVGATLDTISPHGFEDSTVFAAKIDHYYSYAFFEGKKVNGKYVKIGGFHIELDPVDQKTFKRFLITGDTSAVVNKIGYYAFIGSQVDRILNSIKPKQTKIYVGDKKYLITIKEIK